MFVPSAAVLQDAKKGSSEKRRGAEQVEKCSTSDKNAELGVTFHLAVKLLRRRARHTALTNSRILLVALNSTGLLKAQTITTVIGN